MSPASLLERYLKLATRIRRHSKTPNTPPKHYPPLFIYTIYSDSAYKKEAKVHLAVTYGVCKSPKKEGLNKY